MASFDYITAKDFRESLESDYLEMRKCLDVEAWKSAQVAAGSIVEALLVDYLSLPTTPPRTGKNPLSMDLGEAIALCRAENAVSDRTADLCSVIKSYRNLIHPGRMVRLREPPPDKQSAAVAMSLVEMIVDELAKVRRRAVGLTAEQILSKLLRDANSLSVLKHLMKEVSEEQRERLLVELMPDAHANSLDEPFQQTASRLAAAYRAILETATKETRQCVAMEFVKVLREADGARVVSFGDTFFKPADLEFVPDQHKAMVREHILSRVTSTHTGMTLRLVEGIAPHLTKEDVVVWLDPFIVTLSSNVHEIVMQQTRTHLMETATQTSAIVNAAIDRRLDDWIAHYTNALKAPETAELVKQLKKDLDIRRVP